MQKALFGINRICELLAISKNTFYNSKDPKERFLDKYKEIKEFVIKIIEDNSEYGVKRIKRALKDDYNIFVGRDQLAKLLVLWGLALKRNIKKKDVSMIQKILIAMAGRANLLIRTTLSEPMQANL